MPRGLGRGGGGGYLYDALKTTVEGYSNEGYIRRHQGHSSCVESVAVSHHAHRIRYLQEGDGLDVLGVFGPESQRVDVLRVPDRAWSEARRAGGRSPGYSTMQICKTADAFNNTTSLADSFLREHRRHCRGHRCWYVKEGFSRGLDNTKGVYFIYRSIDRLIDALIH